jgi:hypothetical protein
MPEFYRLIDLCVGQEIRHTDFEVTARVNFVLDLSPAYEKLYENFSRNCKRNIETSLEKRQDLSMDIKPSEVTGLFRKNKGKELREIKQRDYNRLENLMDYCFNSNRGRIVGVRNDNGKLIYGLFYIFLNGNKTMIFLANTPESHERRTGYYVYNELIKESAGTGAQFDFAGSSIPSIARFMESFGSKSFHYYRIYRNRLPWPLRYFK